MLYCKMKFDFEMDSVSILFINIHGAFKYIDILQHSHTLRALLYVLLVPASMV